MADTNTGFKPRRARHSADKNDTNKYKHNGHTTLSLEIKISTRYAIIQSYPIAAFYDLCSLQVYNRSSHSCLCFLL